MHIYEEKKFNLLTLKGLSEKQIDVHLGLYSGYVKHVNHLREQIKSLKEADAEKYSYAIIETRRRFGFEFNGMRMHEYYFLQLEGGGMALDENSNLTKAISKKYGSLDGFIAHITEIGMSRGIGWTILYKDVEHNTIHTAWISDHELGQLGGMPIIFAMDMWEHAFMIDYLPTEKKQYIEAYIANTNWKVVENRFTKAT